MIHVLDNESVVNFGAWFNLPGSVQTVGRGELFCLYLLLSKLESDSDVTYVTDNLNVKDIFYKGPMAGKNNCNCDLWRDIFDFIVRKNLAVRMDAITHQRPQT